MNLILECELLEITLIFVTVVLLTSWKDLSIPLESKGMNLCMSWCLSLLSRKLPESYTVFLGGQWEYWCYPMQRLSAAAIIVECWSSSASGGRHDKTIKHGFLSPILVLSSLLWGWQIEIAVKKNKITFSFIIISNLQKSCRNIAKKYHILYTQIPQLVTFHHVCFVINSSLPPFCPLYIVIF